MRKIELTQGKVALVDDEDFDKLNAFKWCAGKYKEKWYAQRVRCVGAKRKFIFMHREIMDAPKGVQVDHRNNDGLFNCKENLRLCTNQQNGFNQKIPHKENKLGIKGVHYHNNYKFHAQIKVNGKPIHLGYFNILGDADSAYRIAEDKYFGEFSRNRKELLSI